MTGRIFKISPEGETTIEPNAAQPDEDDAQTAADQPKSKKGSAENATDRLADRALQEMSFSTHILSLNATALFHLGLLEEGDTPGAPDFESAAQVIDTLAMLKEKTKGNLTDAETRLLDSILYDLRIQFARIHK